MGHDVLLSPFVLAQPDQQHTWDMLQVMYTGPGTRSCHPSSSSKVISGLASPPQFPHLLNGEDTSFICCKRREFLTSMAVVSQKAAKSIGQMESAEAAAWRQLGSDSPALGSCSDFLHSFGRLRISSSETLSVHLYQSGFEGMLLVGSLENMKCCLR